MSRLTRLQRQRQALARLIVDEGSTPERVGHLITLQRRIDKELGRD